MEDQTKAVDEQVDTAESTDDAASAASELEQGQQEGEAAQQEVSTETEQLRAQLEEQQQRLLRLQADYDNFRRRSRLEKEEALNYGASKLLGGLLPVVDNLERALAASKGSQDYEALVKGLDMIQRQLSQALEQEGLKPMEAVGQPFNPEFHQAVMQVETDEHEEGTVVEELQRGYLLKDKVIRPAMVKVSVKP